MKSNYIKPEIVIVELVTEQIMALSDRIPIGGEGTPATKYRDDEFVPIEDSEWGDLW